jgi:hypothetical protein
MRFVHPLSAALACAAHALSTQALQPGNPVLSRLESRQLGAAPPLLPPLLLLPGPV